MGKSLFLSILYKQLQVISEVFEGLCDIANKLVVFDVAVLFQCTDDEAFVLFDLIDMFDDTLIELLVLHVADVGYLDLLYLFVL